jgi:hypothetical protein
VIAKTPANERFPRGTPVAERRLWRGTAEKLHSRAETPKGPTVVGPFDVRDLLVAGARFELWKRPLMFEFLVPY